MEKNSLSDELFKHFIKFLKTNGLYADYVYNFFHNNEVKYKDVTHQFEDYKEIMRERSKNGSYKHFIEEFKSMFLTFASFTWARHNNYSCLIDIEFTKKWCSVNIKWALYCLKHRFEICSETRFARLLRYYKDQHWLSGKILTKEEIKLINELTKPQLEYTWI